MVIQVELLTRVVSSLNEVFSLYPDTEIRHKFDTVWQVKEVILFDIGEVPAGAAENDVFTAPAPGQYTVICTVAGHYPLMQV